MVFVWCVQFYDGQGPLNKAPPIAGAQSDQFRPWGSFSHFSERFSDHMGVKIGGHQILVVPSPFFPGILLSRKPPETQGNGRFSIRRMVGMGNQPEK